MIDRRTLLPALAMLGTSAAAGLWRLNRKQVPADQQPSLEQIVPKRFGNWSEVPNPHVVQPTDTNDLEHEIYSQELSRGYRNPDGAYIMLLIAYGPSQSDYLQIHQPEVCYISQGFRVNPLPQTALPLQGGETLPLRRLSTWRAGRPEPVSYWTRVGNQVTRSQADRLLVRFRYGLAGYIPDGILVRVSNISPETEPSFQLQDDFIMEMLRAVAPQYRGFLVGTLAPAIGA